MADRVRITSDSRRRPPRVKVDVIVLVVLVLTALTLAPGHGLWGWALALVAGVFVGVVVGIAGRRYPWSHHGVRRLDYPAFPELVTPRCHVLLGHAFRHDKRPGVLD